MSGLVIDTLAEHERHARATAEDKARSESDYLAKAYAEADAVDKRALLALSQIEGCHKRHWRRIADACALAIKDSE